MSIIIIPTGLDLHIVVFINDYVEYDMLKHVRVFLIYTRHRPKNDPISHIKRARPFSNVVESHWLIL